MDDTPAMDKGSVGKRVNSESKDFGGVVNFNKKQKPKFEGFK
jgi:hypothetical protein